MKFQAHISNLKHGARADKLSALQAGQQRARMGYGVLGRVDVAVLALSAVSSRFRSFSSGFKRACNGVLALLAVGVGPIRGKSPSTKHQAPENIQYSIAQAVAALMLLSVCGGSAAELQFSWRANSEAELAGYKLYQGPASGFYTGYEVLGAGATNCTMAVQGSKQYFALSAFDVWGQESDLTEELVWEPPATLRLVSERSVDGVLWEAAATNAVVAARPMELWRLRIE